MVYPSLWAWFCVLLLFQIGSNVIFGFAAGAKQDAWLVAALSTTGGMGLVWLYTKLFDMYPSSNWGDLLKQVLGRYAGTALAAVYFAEYAYVASRVLRDFGELSNSHLLESTPIAFTMMVFLLVCMYACYAGAKRIALFAELAFHFFWLFLLAFFLLLLCSMIMNKNYLFPVASDWKKIMTTVFPLGINIPFGEVIVFSTFWTQMGGPHIFKKAMLRSALISGIMLMLLDLVAVLTLGPDIFSRAVYPMLLTAQMIGVADFIENVDPIIVSIFMIGGMFKITIFFYAACVGMMSLFGRSNYRVLIAPVGIIIWVLAYFSAANISRHIYIGLKFIPIYVATPLFIVIPLLVYLIGLGRKKLGGGAS